MKFETPDVEIIYLDADDIVCSSVGGDCNSETPNVPIPPSSANSLNGKKEE